MGSLDLPAREVDRTEQVTVDLFWAAVLDAPGALLAVLLALVASAILAGFPETAGLARIVGADGPGPADDGTAAPAV